RVVALGGGGGRIAGQRLRGAVAVRVADHDAKLQADIGVAERIGRRIDADVAPRRAVDGSLPLIVKRAEPVGVLDGRRIGGEDLGLGGVSAHHPGAGRGGVGRVVDGAARPGGGGRPLGLIGAGGGGGGG